jgi:hypothetical protein
VPDYRQEDPGTGRERFHRQNVVKPGRWLRVVRLNNVPAWIVTVLVQDNDPRQTQR